MVDIVDVNGKPIKSEALKTQQTSRLAQLHREFATHPSRGLTPSRLANILQQAEMGNIAEQHNLFEDMEEKDAHIHAEMSKRKRALLTEKWDIVPPRNASGAERKLAGYAREAIEDIPNFEDVILDALDGIGHGFSCQEIEWELYGKEWVPKQFNHRPQSWFQTDVATRTEIRLRDMSQDGQALQPFGWLTHVHKAKSGYLSRAGLFRVLVWPYLFKHYSVGDLAEFLEIYGLPLRLGKYTINAGDEEKATLMRAVMSIGHNAAGIIPEGMAIEFIEAAKGSPDPFMAMIDWCEKSASKAILGGTLTSQADGKTSTNALGNVHNEVRHDLMVSDARQLGGTFTRDLVFPLLYLNKGGVQDRRRLPKFKFIFDDTEDLTVLAEALPKLVGSGMRITRKWAHERAGIPEPEDSDELLTVSVPSTSAAAATSTAALSAVVDAPGGNPTVAEEDALAAATAAHWDVVIGSVKNIVDSATSMAALEQQLTDAYGSLTTDELTRIMAAGFALAELRGIADVSDGR